LFGLCVVDNAHHHFDIIVGVCANELPRVERIIDNGPRVEKSPLSRVEPSVGARCGGTAAFVFRTRIRVVVMVVSGSGVHDGSIGCAVARVWLHQTIPQMMQ